MPSAKAVMERGPSQKATPKEANLGSVPKVKVEVRKVVRKAEKAVRKVARDTAASEAKVQVESRVANPKASQTMAKARDQAENAGHVDRPATSPRTAKTATCE